MRRRELRLVISFSTTTAAMEMEELCRRFAVGGRLIPVPESITAGCGLAWCAAVEEREALETFMAQQGICPEGVQECWI